MFLLHRQTCKGLAVFNSLHISLSAFRILHYFLLPIRRLVCFLFIQF